MDGRKILLTGASGLLGQRLLPELEVLGSVHAPPLQEFDLLRPETIKCAFEGFLPDLVIHLAAETRVDHCEGHPEVAFRVNAEGTAQVARLCRDRSVRLVFLSSDYVFDGARRIPYLEQDPTAPLNVYGKSKEEGEQAVLQIAPDRLVIRSSSLFGHGGRHFVAGILEQARRGGPLKIVDDQIQSPTFVGHLAPALARAASSDRQGILHLAGRGECSWYEFGRAVLARGGLSVPCEPVSSKDLARPARRPGYSVLDTRLAEETLGICMPDWQDGLEAYFRGA